MTMKSNPLGYRGYSYWAEVEETFDEAPTVWHRCKSPDGEVVYLDYSPNLIMVPEDFIRIVWYHQAMGRFLMRDDFKINAPIGRTELLLVDDPTPEVND